jgi:antitoxin YefM
MVMTTETLATVKANFSAFVDEVHRTHERVEITRNGTPAAVLIAPDDLAALEETIALLSDPDARQSVAEGRADIERGDTLSWDQVTGPAQ